MDIVARSGQAVLNVRGKTLKGLVISIIGQQLASQSVRMVSDEEALVILDGIWNGLQGVGYLGVLKPSPALFQSLLATLQDIRCAGLNATGLMADRFEVPAKGEELAALLDEYLAQLKRRNLVDYAEALQLATSRVQDCPESFTQILLLVPADSRLFDRWFCAGWKWRYRTSTGTFLSV
jgi:hypothetical protein